VSVFVSARSAEVVTLVVSVSELFVPSGSVVVLEIVAVLLSVEPLTTLELTRATIVMADVPGANDGFVANTVPLAPTAGVVRVQPAGAVAETNVVPAGSASVSVAFRALSGPLFVACSV